MGMSAVSSLQLPATMTASTRICLERRWVPDYFPSHKEHNGKDRVTFLLARPCTTVYSLTFFSCCFVSLL